MTGDIATIRLLRYPLRHYLRSRAHFDELLRELQLLDLGQQLGTTHRDLPQRLSDLVTEITTRYRARVDELDVLRNAAIERGELSIDLVYDVPVEVGESVTQIAALLEECDQFCRNGQHLLTLATPPDMAEFRQWNLTEILRQIDGEEPIPWPGDL
jgi:hypothetical protein